MFCPKCGTQAIAGTKFCRNCGSDLEVVSAALTGTLVAPSQKMSKKGNDWEHTNDPDKLWGSFITKSLTGLAFIVIALFLTFTGTIGGHVWGFWLLIPGAASLGAGISSYLKAKRIERTRTEFNSLATTRNVATMFPNQSNSTLPPPSTKFSDLYTPPARNTGELVMPPASVTENTTRHLEINSEGETINLPQK